MSAPQTPVRTVLVQSPARSREGFRVAQASVAVAALAFLLAGLRSQGTAAPAPAYPYQVRFDESPPHIQRVCRDLVAAVPDILSLRSENGEWPSVQALGDDFVPPFVRVPGMPAVASWEFVRESGIVNYLGRPLPETGDPAFLLLIQENVLHPPGYVPNEFDRQLDDGTSVHVGVWFLQEAGDLPEHFKAPERRGWTQVVTATTSVPGS